MLTPDKASRPTRRFQLSLRSRILLGTYSLTGREGYPYHMSMPENGEV